jgi:hypothetical protein
MTFPPTRAERIRERVSKFLWNDLRFCRSRVGRAIANAVSPWSF